MVCRELKLHPPHPTILGVHAEHRPDRREPNHEREPARLRPDVRLGALQDGGLAPAIMAIVDRGLRRNPRLSHALTAEIELCFKEGYPPVRIDFRERMVLIEDGPAVYPDLRVTGSLPD